MFIWFILTYFEIEGQKWFPNKESISLTKIIIKVDLPLPTSLLTRVCEGEFKRFPEEEFQLGKKFTKEVILFWLHRACEGM